MKFNIFLLLLLVSIVNSSQVCNTIYQIFTASYKDSNGDGIGDFKGLVSELDYISYMGFDCVLMTPFFKSGNIDSGYDITDYKEIDEHYGDMQNFNQMMEELERRKLKLIIDLVINHSSEQHKWFQLSIDRVHPYTDYYVWANPKGYDQNNNPIVPNNWQNVFSGSAWSWNDKRKQFYLHQFVYNQPDLNFANSQLLEEMKEIIIFWVDKGVGGMRMDAAQYLVEDAQLRDEPVNDPNKKDIRHGDMNHIYTINTRGTYDVIRILRDFTTQYCDRKILDEVIFVIEATNANTQQLMDYFKVATFPFNFALIYMNGWLNAQQYHDLISNWNQNLPEGATSNWMAENPDSWRIGSRYCDEYAAILTMLMMVLPGVAIFYYGQEIGMKNFDAPNIENDARKRLPMQWNASKNSGFSTKQDLALPVNPNYWKENVEFQKEEESTNLHMFKRLMVLRETKTLKHGALKMHVISNWILALVREDNPDNYVTIINFGTKTEFVNLFDVFKNVSKFKVEVETTNSGYSNGYRIKSSRIFQMRPLSGMVLSYSK